jgi:hypothetical protein
MFVNEQPALFFFEYALQMLRIIIIYIKILYFINNEGGPSFYNEKLEPTSLAM